MFLNTKSGGLRPLAVTAALFRTLEQALSLFSRVEAQGINEADAAGGIAGDIICYGREDEEQVCLVVEVKDQDLTLAHVRASSMKAKQADKGLANLLFAVPSVKPSDKDQIESLISREWASGLNIYATSIPGLIQSLFVLVDEKWRVVLLRMISDELDKRQNQPARKDWYDLLISENFNERQAVQ